MKWLKTFENYGKINIPEYFYHGTNEVFDKFTLDYMGKNHPTSILGVYFTQYLFPPLFSSSAGEYAYDISDKNGGVPVVYKCKIHLHNPLIKDSSKYYSSNTFIDYNCNELKNEVIGHDGIIVYNKNDGNDFILVTNELNKIEIINKAILPELDIKNKSAPASSYAPFYQLRDTIKL